jgi:chromosome segregation ATPase
LSEYERNIKSGERHSLGLVHEIEGLRTIEAQNFQEKRHLKEEIDKALGQVTAKNVDFKAAEGNNHRLNLALTEKKGECDLLMARISEIDAKRLDQQQVNIERKQQIDRLKSDLERAEVKASVANERLQSLSIQLTEKDGQLGSDTQRIVFLEAKLTGLEHEKQLLNDRLEHTRLSNENIKKQNVALTERLGSKSTALDNNELKKQSMEGIIKHQTTELENRRLAEEQLKNKISKLTEERKSLAERVTGLQRAVSQLAAEKQNEHDLYKKHSRDAKQLRKNVDEAEKERLNADKTSVKLVEDKSVLEQRLLTANHEIKDLRDLCAKLELQIQDTATIYERRLEDQTERYRRDMEIELDRVRGVMVQQDRTIDARERAHDARISILEDTCQDLREKAGKGQRQNRRKQRQTAELLSDLRRSTSPLRKSQVRH